MVPRAGWALRRRFGRESRARGNNLLGNGFPSGPHFNLIIHGKKETFTCPGPKYEWTITGTTDGHVDDGHDGGTVVVAESCPAGHTCNQGSQVYGNVIFVPRGGWGEGPVNILMESGAKGPKSQPSLTELQVTDWCTTDLDGNDAVLRLPRDPDGYAVYARVLGKPGEDGGPTFDFTSRELVLVEDEFGNNLLLLGLVTASGDFSPLGEPLTRYDTNAKGKGAQKAVNITELFEWSGEVCYVNDVEFFCPDFEGCILRDQPVCCVPVDVDTGAQVPLSSCTDPALDGYAACQDSTFDAGSNSYVCPATIDFDGVAPEELACPVVPVCKTYDGEWIFNIADFVNVLFGIDPDGSYTVQIRFYPLPLINGQQP